MRLTGVLAGQQRRGGPGYELTAVPTDMAQQLVRVAYACMAGERLAVTSPFAVLLAVVLCLCGVVPFVLSAAVCCNYGTSPDLPGS